MRSYVFNTLALVAIAPTIQASHGYFQAYKGECDKLAGPQVSFSTEGSCVHMTGKSSFDISGKLPKGAHISYLGNKPKKDGSCDFSGDVGHGKVYTSESCYPLAAVQAADFEVNAIWIEAA